MRDGTGQKNGGGGSEVIKEWKITLSFLYRTDTGSLD